MGYYSTKKMQAFLFLQLIVLMHFVPVEFFILEIKGYNKKILEKMLFWPLCWRGLTLTWSSDFSIAGLQNVGFWYLRFSRWSLAWVLSRLFPHLCVSFLLFSFFLSFFLFFIIYLLKKQRVSECQIFLSFILFYFIIFFFFIVLASLSIPEHYKFHLDFLYCAVYMIRQFLKKKG